MKTIVNNLAVEYLDEGSGPHILMLHGWGNTMRYLDTLCNELKDCRVVRLDLPGFGDSEKAPAPWNVEDYARFIEKFCEKLQIKPRAMFGHSFGGRILTKGVGEGILHPEKIILAASAGVADRKTKRNMLYASIAKIGRYVLAPFSEKLYQRARHALYNMTGSDYLTTGKMSETFLKVIREDLSPCATKIATPTLLIWGADDAVTPLSEGKKLNELIRNSVLHVIAGAAHFVYRDNPKEVARLIREFV